jgi:hypothetical protein
VEDPKKLAFEHIQKGILHWYDFIAVTERWEESMVVMKLDAFGIVGYDRIEVKSHYVPKATASSAVAEYLQTTFGQSNADYLLYAALNESIVGFDY